MKETECQHWDGWEGEGGGGGGGERRGSGTSHEQKVAWTMTL